MTINKNIGHIQNKTTDFIRPSGSYDENGSSSI